MSELNECYAKLMEYVYCIDRCLKLSSNNKNLARLTQFKKPDINDMESRILISVCRDLGPLTLEGKCLLETKNSKVDKYVFQDPEKVHDEMFKARPVIYASNTYQVKEVCLYNVKWLKEYYSNPYELLSKAGTDKTHQKELIEKQKLKQEKRATRVRGTVVKGAISPLKTNFPKEHSNPNSNNSTPAFSKRNKKNGNKSQTPLKPKEEQQQQHQQQQPQHLTPNSTPNSTPTILPRQINLQQQQYQTPVSSTSQIQSNNGNPPINITRTPIQRQVITPTKQYTQQPQSSSSGNYRVLVTAEPVVTPSSITSKNNMKERQKTNLLITIKEPEKKEKYVWCCCEESKSTACCYDFARNILTFCLLLVFIALLTLRFVKYLDYSSSLLQKYAVIAMFSLLGIAIEILELCINCCKIQSLHYMGYRIYSGVIALYYLLIGIYGWECDSSLPFECLFVMALVHLFGICWKKPTEV